MNTAIYDAAIHYERDRTLEHVDYDVPEAAAVAHDASNACPGGTMSAVNRPWEAMP